VLADGLQFSMLCSTSQPKERPANSDAGCVYVSVQIVLFQIIFWPRMLLFLASSIKTPHRGCCWLTTDTQLMSPNIAAAQAPNAAIPASQQFQVEYDKQVNMPSSCSSSNS